MAQIPQAELPQPFYPDLVTVPPVVSPARVPASGIAARPARLMWVLVAVIGAAVVAVGAAAAVALSAIRATPPPPSAPPPSPTPESGTGAPSVELTAAVNTLIAGEDVAGDDRSCLSDSLSTRPDMVTAVNENSYDPAELAALMSECISPESVAATIMPALDEAGYTLTPAQESCVLYRIEALTPADVEDLLYVGFVGTPDEILDAHLAIWGDCLV